MKTKERYLTLAPPTINLPKTINVLLPSDIEEKFGLYSDEQISSIFEGYGKGIIENIIIRYLKGYIKKIGNQSGKT